MPDFGGYSMSEKDPGWKDLKIKTAEKNALRIKGLPVGRKQSKLPVIQGGMGVGISLSGLAGRCFLWRHRTDLRRPDRISAAGI